MCSGQGGLVDRTVWFPVQCGLRLEVQHPARVEVGGESQAGEDGLRKLRPWRPKEGHPWVRTSRGITSVAHSIPQTLVPVFSSDTGWQPQWQRWELTVLVWCAVIC